MTTGENIRRIRKERGYTQKRLADKCEMYESQIRKYELDKANPKIETLEKIAAALDCAVSDIRGFDASIRIKPSPEQIEINRIGNMLLNNRESVTPEELKLLKEYYNSENMTARFGRMTQSVRKAFNALAYGRIQAACEELNEAGQEKVAEHAEMIAKIPEYQKKADEPPTK